MTSFVLVPGAWLGGWVWNNVSPLLTEEGHKVYPITLTGMGEKVHLASETVGMETGIQDVLNVIKYNDLTDVVLVGHSFAGKIVASVADQVPDRIGTLLYLDSCRAKDYKIEGPYKIIDSGHWPMITKPKELSEDLIILSKGSAPQIQAR